MAGKQRNRIVRRKQSSRHINPADANRRAFAASMRAMAADPEICAISRRIMREFRTADGDGLPR